MPQFLSNNLQVVTGTLQLDDTGTPTKSYRLRTDGGDLDMEGSGRSIFLSVWSGAGFTGTQRNKLVLESGADITQAIGLWQFRNAPFGIVMASIDGATGSIIATKYLNISGLASDERQMRFQTSAVNRWTMGATPGTEPGDGSGSDFTFARWNDAGAWIDNPIQIVRLDGTVVVNTRLTSYGRGYFRSYVEIDAVSGDSWLSINGSAAAWKHIKFRTGGETRWEIGAYGAESTGNAGSNIEIDRWSDDNTYIETCIRIVRSTGELHLFKKLDMKSNLIANVATPVAGTDAANKTYVDARTPQVTVSTTAPSSPAVGDVWIDAN
jgi:hypothetical protein